VIMMVCLLSDQFIKRYCTNIRRNTLS